MFLTHENPPSKDDSQKPGLTDAIILIWHVPAKLQ